MLGQHQPAPPAELWAVLAPSGLTATFGTEPAARAHVAAFGPDIRERLEVARYVRANEAGAEVAASGQRKESWRAEPNDSTRLGDG